MDMAKLDVVNELLEEFEGLSKEEQIRRVNEEYTIEQLDVLHAHGYDFPANDGRLAVEKQEKTEKG